MSAWVRQMFQSQISKRGGVVRRKITTIDKFAAQTNVKSECAKRDCSIVRHGDQWLVFCDTASLKIIARVDQVERAVLEIDADTLGLWPASTSAAVSRRGKMLPREHISVG